MADTRIVSGFSCAWWGSISEAAAFPNGIPCCPHCKGVLLETESLEAWWTAIDAFEANGNPGYRAIVEWLRGKHFHSFVIAREVYNRSKVPPRLRHG